MVCCHVNEVCRLRYITQLYSIIGDANAVKETALKPTNTRTQQGLQEFKYFNSVWKNGAINSFVVCVCTVYVCMSSYRLPIKGLFICVTL